MNPTNDVALSEALAAVTTGAVLVDCRNEGVLHISGATRLDLLNRMSTQALAALRDGQGAATVLTSDIGRIIARLIVYAAADHLIALTGDHNPDNIARYLLRFVFYNDDFRLRNVSAETTVLAVYGAGAVDRLTAAGLAPGDLPRHHWRRLSADGLDVTVHRAEPIGGDGYYLLAAAADRDALHQRLTAAGCVPVTPAAYDYLRIDAGLPRAGHELTLDYIPLETGLWDDVSFSKGCYIGQEIIARMESRGRLAKKLVRLSAATPLTPGAAVMAGERTVGTITSAATGAPGPVALAYVKTTALDEAAPLTVDGVPVQVR